MELRDYVRILHKNWALILASVILGLAIGGAITFLTKPTYKSTTQLYVSVQTEGAATGELVQGTTFARQAVASYVDVVNTALVLDPVIEDLGLDLTPAELASKVSASTPLNTVLIDITATDTDPDRAARIANATGTSLADAVQETLEAPKGTATASPVQVTVVQPAAVPVAPSSPNTGLNLTLGALLGLAVGIAFAVLRTVLDTRIHTTADVEATTEKPLLGGIAFDPDADERPLIVHADPRSPRSESFRSLRTNLQFLNIEGGPRSFVVTSAGPGEGKSTTTANLAITLAETGARVALIDGDLRLPRVSLYMDLEGGVGLTDVLIGRIPLADALQQWGTGQLYVLASGPVPPNPSELLGSDAMDQVLEALTEHFDFVLIDAPPVLVVTDAAILSRKTRGAILVAASGSTTKQELAAAVNAISTANGTLLGTVVTMLPTKGPDSYGYGSYSYSADNAPKHRKQAEKRRAKAQRKLEKA